MLLDLPRLNRAVGEALSGKLVIQKQAKMSPRPVATLNAAVQLVIPNKKSALMLMRRATASV